MADVDLKKVVTCFLEYGGRILILKRGEKVKTYKGKWSAVAGYIEEGERPDDTARKEISEEVGVGNAKLIARGAPYEFYDLDLGVVWFVHPYRFAVESNKVSLDWENVESKWILPEELKLYDTVPMLRESWKRVSRPG
ncbi:MAG: NUDIX domain-containing protein [Candidatus Hadarchaeota archaeon]